MSLVCVDEKGRCQQSSHGHEFGDDFAPHKAEVMRPNLVTVTNEDESHRAAQVESQSPTRK